MSRNSKNVRKLRAAKQISAQRKGGNKGPSSTTKVNRKKNTWYAKYKRLTPRTAAPAEEALPLAA